MPMLKAAVDVFYRQESAKAVCILFEHWQAREVFSTQIAFIENVAAYEPGAFYQRELPCILTVLQQVKLELLDAIVVDGYVYLDDEGRKGLGAYLFDAIHKKVPVIGVAKTRFAGNTRAAAIYRGQSRNPLYITAAGMPVAEAAAAVQSMAGEYRMPLLLQQLDRITKE